MSLSAPPGHPDSRFEAPRIREIADALPAMIAYWRRDLICLHANESYLHWFGRRRDEVVGHHIREVIGEIPFTLNQPFIAGALRGEPQAFERELPRPSGGVAMATANYIPDVDETGAVLGFYALVSDISHLRRTEEQLRKSEAELRGLLRDSREASAWQTLAEQVAHVGHWRVNLTDNSVVWSAEVFRIHGLDPAHHRPTLDNALSLYHAEDRPRIASIVTEATETGTPFEFDARIIRRDGDVRYVRSRGMAMRDEDGRPLSLFGVFIDVTEQIEAEQALRLVNQRLETMVHRDGLTDLANRRHFDAALDRAWQEAGNGGAPLSLAMIDVDCFKSFNDCYGHQAGDECLAAVARAIEGSLDEPQALAARYGGEEFALLLPGVDEARAAQIAERTRARVKALGLPHEGNPRAGGVVSISLGLGTAWPARGGAPAALLREADSYLYEAKRRGRDRMIDRSRLAIPARPEGDEAARLAAVSRYRARGLTGRAGRLDRLAATAARLLGTPIALVTLVAEDTQFILGNHGLEGTSTIPRDQAFCPHTIQHDAPMLVQDAWQDGRFAQNPLVTGAPGIRFYMGAPITSLRDGQKLGALCVIDRAAHDGVDPKAREILEALAALAAEMIEDAVETEGVATAG
ncbi:diguanylate cyclase domain-containing protein [Acidisoma sp. 7E03]